MADFSLNVKINGVEQSVSTIKEIEQALKQTKAELKNVEVGSAAFEELSSQAQKLQFQFKENFKEATNFYQSLGDLAESVGRIGATVTAGFTIASSAASLFGSENEAITKAAEKAQQGLALAYSFTTIATNAKRLAEDLGNVATALGINLSRAKTATTEAEAAATVTSTVAEEANTVAEVANTTATKAGTVATKAATIAQEGMNLAMKATPIGLLIAGLTALVVYWDDIFDSISAAEQATIDYNAEQAKVAADIEQNTFKAIGGASIKYNELANAITDANDAGSKQSWIKEALKDLPELSALTGKEADAEEKVKEALYTRANLNEVEAKRAAILERMAGYEAKIVEYNNNYAKGTREQQEALAAQSDEALKMVGILRNQLTPLNQSVELFRKQQQAIADANAELEKKKEAEKKAAEEAKRRAEEAAKEYKRKYEDIKKTVVAALKDIGDLEKAYDEEEKRSRFTTKLEEVNFELSLEEKKLKEKEAIALKEIANSVLKGKEKIDAENKVKDATIAAMNELYGVDGKGGVAGVRRKAASEEDQKVIDQRLKDLEEVLTANKVLNDEVSYGDLNTSDNKIKYSLNASKIEIAQLDLLASMNEEQRVNYISGLSEEEQALYGSYTKRLFNFEAYYEQRKKAVKAGLAVEEKLEISQAEANGRVLTQENIKNLQERFNIKIKETENGYKIEGKVSAEEEAAILENLSKQKANATEETEKEVARIKGEYRVKNAEADKSTDEDVLKAKVANLQKYTDLAAQMANTVLGVFNAFNELAKVNSDNYLMSLRDQTAQQTNILNEEYNNQKALLDQKLADGLISQEAYNTAVASLDKNLTDSTKKLNDEYRDKELAEKRKAFESDKKLKTAQAIISGIQGAVSAFAGAMTLGPIAGPIVGGVLAALVTATTAAQVAAIQKTKFDSGAPEITAPNTGGASTGGSALSSAASSSGGYTTFNSTLTGSSVGGTTTTPISVGGDIQKVVVVESDITKAQKRVSTLEANATFG